MTAVECSVAIDCLYHSVDKTMSQLIDNQKKWENWRKNTAIKADEEKKLETVVIKMIVSGCSLMKQS